MNKETFFNTEYISYWQVLSGTLCIYFITSTPVYVYTINSVAVFVLNAVIMIRTRGQR